MKVPLGELLCHDVDLHNAVLSCLRYHLVPAWVFFGGVFLFVCLFVFLGF